MSTEAESIGWVFLFLLDDLYLFSHVLGVRFCVEVAVGSCAEPIGASF